MLHDLPQATGSCTKSMKIIHRFLDSLFESSVSMNRLDRYKEQLDSGFKNILQITIPTVRVVLVNEQTVGRGMY